MIDDQWDFIKVLSDGILDALKDAGIIATKSITGQRWINIHYPKYTNKPIISFKIYYREGTLEIASYLTEFVNNSQKSSQKITRNVGALFSLADPNCFQKLAQKTQQIYESS